MEEKATLGGGCFWCLEAVYQDIKGVSLVESGYAGGSISNPKYREVCSGATGHAEVVQITFDPQKVSYKDMLDVFFTIHDPTTLNRQGNDHGTQYRSIILYHSEEQRVQAVEYIEGLGKSGLWSNPVVTEVVPLDVFYRAEEYHQNYFKSNPNQPYCRIVVEPKVTKARAKFLDKLYEG